MRISDWSSDVCSSDLAPRSDARASRAPHGDRRRRRGGRARGDGRADRSRARRHRNLNARRRTRDNKELAQATCIRFKAACSKARCVKSDAPCSPAEAGVQGRSEEHTSELQSLMRISYAVFCLKKKKPTYTKHTA